MGKDELTQKRVMNALRPRIRQPSEAVSLPSGRMSIDRIHRAMQEHNRLNEALASVHPQNGKSLSGNSRTVYDVALVRLRSKSMPSSHYDVIDYLRTYQSALDSNRFSSFESYNHLSPLAYGMYHEKYRSLLLEKTQLFLLTYANGISAWSDLYTKILFAARSAFDDFKGVALEQWKVDNRGKRIGLFILRAAIGLTLGAVGMGFLGNLVGGVVSNWLGQVDGNVDVGIFKKDSWTLSSDAYKKTAVPDVSKGLVSDIGGWFRDQLFDAATPEPVAEDPDTMLEHVSSRLQDLMENLRTQGKENARQLMEMVNHQLRKNTAWSVCFEKSKPGRPHIDDALYRDLEIIANEIGNTADKALNVVVGCPFLKVNEANIKKTIEKIFWALYIQARFSSPDADSVGAPVIDRLANHLNVGQRRTDTQFFWRSSEFEAHDQQTTKDISDINPAGNTLADRKNARSALKTQEGNILYGKWSGGKQTDDQLKAWSAQFLRFNPLEGELPLDDRFLASTGPNRADVDAWEQLVDKFKAGRANLQGALTGALSGIPF